MSDGGGMASGFPCPWCEDAISQVILELTPGSIHLRCTNCMGSWWTEPVTTGEAET